MKMTFHDLVESIICILYFIFIILLLCTIVLIADDYI